MTTASKEFLWMKKRVLVPGLIKAELLAFRSKLGGGEGDSLLHSQGSIDRRRRCPSRVGRRNRYINCSNGSTGAFLVRRQRRGRFGKASAVPSIQGLSPHHASRRRGWRASGHGPSQLWRRIDLWLGWEWREFWSTRIAHGFIGVRCVVLYFIVNKLDSLRYHDKSWESIIRFLSLGCWAEEAFGSAPKNAATEIWAKRIESNFLQAISKFRTFGELQCAVRCRTIVPNTQYANTIKKKCPKHGSSRV